MTERPDPYQQPPALIRREVGDRQRLLRHEAEDYLRGVVMDYAPRQQQYWQRDYSSVEAFAQSVAANRERWGEAIGVFVADGTDLDPQLELWCENERFTAWWLSVGLLGGFARPGYFGRAQGPR